MTIKKDDPMAQDIYENACNNSDCHCRQDPSWPDNIKDGCLNEVAYEFSLDNILSVYAPEGRDPDTLIEQALMYLRQMVNEGDVALKFEKISRD